MGRRGFSAFATTPKSDEAGTDAAAAPTAAPAAGAQAAAQSNASAPAGKSLSLDEAKTLLESLRTACTRLDFQKALVNLRNRGWGAFKKRQAVARLLGMAWKSHVKASGFPINAYGFVQMLAAVKAVSDQPGIRTLSEEVERQLKFSPGALFGVKAGDMKGIRQAVQAKAAAPQGAAQGPPPVRDRAINLGEAKELLKTFKEIASRSEFQDGLAKIPGKGPQAFTLKQPLISQHFNATMSQFDFPATPEAYLEMRRGIGTHQANEQVKSAAHEVEQLLGMRPGEYFGILPGPGEAAPAVQPAASGTPAPAAKPSAPAGDTVEFVARHAVEDVEVKLQMPKDATFLQVKQAIAKNVGRDEILKKGRLVKRKGGVYSSYKDHDPIGDIREVLVLGADLKVADSDSDAEPPPVQPAKAAAARPKAPVADAATPSPAASKGPPAAAPAQLPKASPPPAAKAPAPSPAEASPPPPPAARPVEVSIRHAVDGKEIRVQMMTNSTFMEIKEALAKKLGREDIRKRARLVFKSAAGAWASYKDGEVLGDKTELHLLGVDLSMTEPKAAPAEVAKATPTPKPGAVAAAPKAVPAAQAAPSAAAPKPAAKPPVKRELLTLPRAQDLLRRILRICQDPGFQRDLEAAQSKLPGSPNESALKAAVAGVFGSACKNTLGGFGFAEDKAGLEQLSNELWLLAEDPVVVELTAKIEKMLRVPGGSWFGIDNDDVETTAPPPAPSPAAKAAPPAAAPPSATPVQAPSDDGKILPRGQMLQLMDGFEKTFSTEKSQKALETLMKRGGIALQLGLAQLMGAATKEAAKELGLQDWNLQRMVEAVKEHGSDLTIRAKARALEKIMRTEVGKVFGMAEDPTPPPQAAAAPQQQTLLSSEQVTKLLSAFLAAINEPKFTKALDTMYTRGGITLQLGLSQLMGQASKAATNSLGLEDWALQKTLEAVKEHSSNVTIRKSAREIEKALRAEPGKFFGMKEEDDSTGQVSAPAPKAKPSAPAAPKAPPQVEVTVQLGAENATEIKVKVLETATLQELKETVSKQLDRPEVMTKGRLAQKAASGGFIALRGSDNLGNRRSVILLGVDFDDGDDDSDSEEENVDVGEAAVPEVDALGRQSLIARAAQSAAPAPKTDSKEINFEQALALQRDLLEGFSTPDFQKELRKLEKQKKEMSQVKFSKERQDLFLSVQKHILPKYGLKGDAEGVMEMMRQMGPFNDDAEFMIKGVEINAVLGLPVPPGYEKLRPAEMVEVRIRHADLGDEVYVQVPDTCLMNDVLEAVAKEITRPEVTKQGRIVKKMGGVFASYGANEQLGNRRRLSYLGTELTPKPPPDKKEILKMLKLQKELHAAFKSEKFQNKLLSLNKQYALGSGEFRAYRYEEITARQKEILPKFGFQPTPVGIGQMINVFTEIMLPGRAEGPEMDEIRSLANEIEGLLWTSGPPTATETPQAVAAAAVPDAAKVTISVQLGVDGPEHEVLVLPGATIRDLKQAIADKFDKPALAAKGRMVKNIPSGGFSSLNETERIGSRRSFLMLGVDSEDLPAVADGRKAVGAAVQAAEPPRTVEVTVLPAIDGESGQIRVRVLADATIGDVRQAVSDKMNKTFTVSQGRIVKRSGSVGFVSVGNDEKLGSRRKLFITGVDLSTYNDGDVEPPVKLSIEDGKKLLAELNERYSAPAFRKLLQDLTKRHPNVRSIEARREMNGLIRKEQVEVIGKYGFTADDLGAMTMVQTLDVLSRQSNDIGELGGKASQLLDLSALAFEPEAEPQSPTQESQYQGPPQSVEVRLKHADTGDELYVSVLETATIKEVLAATSKKLSNPEVLVRGRVVKKAGGVLTAYSKDEAIGAKRRMLYIGTDLNLPAVEGAIEPGEFNVEWAIELQKENIKILEGEEFQRRFDRLEKDYLKGSMQYRRGVRVLVDEMYQQTLPKYGFKNEVDMMRAYEALGYHPEIDRLGREITSLMRVDERESVATMAQKFEDKTAAGGSKIREVEVRITHVVEETSVSIMVPSTSTLLKVRMIMAEQLGDPQILKKGSIVNLAGESFATLPDQERLGNRRKLSYIGTPLKKQVQQNKLADKENEEPAEEVTVTIRHAVGSGEAQISVPSSAKMQDVKEALLEHLDKKGTDAAKKMRFVERSSGTLRTVPDSEKLSGTQTLLVMGLELPKPKKELKSEAKDELQTTEFLGRLQLNEVISLLRRIQRNCRNPNFQQQIQDVHSSPKSSEMGRRGVIGTLFWANISNEVGSYGFSKTREGSDQMFSEIFNKGTDPQVLELTQDIEKLLKFPVGTWFGISPWIADDSSAGAVLTLEQAKEAAAVAKRVMESRGFRKALDAVREKHGADQERTLVEISFMLLEALRTTTVAFGFGGTPDSPWKMFDATRKLDKNPTIAGLLKDIEKILGFPVGTIVNDTAPESPESPQSEAMGIVEVQVKHAVDKNAVMVTVNADTATMKDVKKAVSERLGKPEVQSSGRMVRLEGGGFTSYKDDERLGKRRRLLYLGTDLLPRLGPSGRPLPQLSVETALEVQREVIDSFKAMKFQGSLEELKRKYPETSKELLDAKLQLGVKEMKRILPKYGFEGSEAGMADMAEAFSTFLNTDISQYSEEIARLLRIGDFEWIFPAADSTPAAAAAEQRLSDGAGLSKAAQEPDEVVVTIHHALDKKVIELKVPRQSMIWEVKKALAEKLNRPEVSRRGRIVKEDPATGSYMACKDQERLGNRRKLLLLGVELATDAELAKAAGDDAESKTEKVEEEPKKVKHSIPELTLAEALDLQRDLIEGFKDEEFQSLLRQLFQNYPTHSPQFQKERMKLFLSVQSVVLPRYGFLGNSRGVADMMQVFTPFNAHQEFEQNGRELNRLLGLEVSGETVAATAPPAPEEVQVTVQHVGADEKVRETTVTVLSTATFQDVKAAAAQKFGNPLILSKGRLAQKVRNGFVSFKDPEPIGKRRTVMLMGVNVEQVDEADDSDEEEADESPQSFGWASAALLEADKVKPVKKKEAKPLNEEVKPPTAPVKALPEELKPSPEVEEQVPELPEAAPVKAEPVVQKPKLSRERLLELQQALIAGFRDQGWQRKLRSLERSHAASKDKKFPAKRQALIWEAQSKVLPQFGFEATFEGLNEMFEAFRPYNANNDDEQLTLNGYEINALLGMPVPAGYETLRPSEDVQVRLRHAETLDEVYVTVPDICTFKDVLDAAAKQLGREAVASSGRIVRKAGEMYMSYGSSEPLGNRRRLLFLGADLTAVPELSAAAEEAAPEERQRIPANWGIDVALKLQRELHAAFSEAQFRRKIDDLEKKLGRSSKEFSVQRLQLVLSEQYKIIPSYGFTKDAAGSRDMVFAMGIMFQAGEEENSEKVAEFLRLNAEIDAVLRTGAAASPQEGKATEVQAQPTSPSMDTEQARSLQLALRDGFAAKEFQDKLQALVQKYPDNQAAFRTERQELVSKVQLQVIPKYGFRADATGIRDMLRALGSFQEDFFIETGNLINLLIGLVPGGAAETSAPKEAEEVDVRVKHADSGDEVHVTVLENAKVRDVLAAAAEKLGREEILTSGRLVRKAGSLLTAYSPEDDIGLRRRMLFIGAQLTPKILSEARQADGTLTLESGRALQKDLYEAFASKRFQSKITELDSKLSRNSFQFMAERVKMIRDAQVTVLPKYGFDPERSDEMLQAFEGLMSHPDIVRASLELNKLLLIDDPDLTKRVEKLDETKASLETAEPEAIADGAVQEGTLPEKVEKVSVTITHGIDDTQVKVSVPSNATLRDVKVAVAEYLEKPGIVQSGSFVRRMGGEGFIGMVDRELLGRRRKLTILGNFDGLKHAREAADKTWDAEEREEEEAAQQSVSKEITVKVRHAADSGEVEVQVPSTAKVKDVKEALVELLGQPKLINQIRLVKRLGVATLVTMRDTEKLNDMRQVFMLGADLPGSIKQDEEEEEDLEGEPTEPGKLTAKQAKALLKRMKRSLGRPDVQMSIKEAGKGSTSEMGRRNALGLIFSTWIRGEIASFGFTDARTGMDAMFQAMFDNSEDPDVLRLMQDVEKLLDVKPGTWFGIAEGYDGTSTPTLTLEQAKDAARTCTFILKGRAFKEAKKALTSAEFLPPTLTYFLRALTLAFGFFSNDQSVDKLFDALKAHAEDQEIRKFLREIEKSLDHEPGTLVASSTTEETTTDSKLADDDVADVNADAETDKQPASVDVSVKHAVDKNSVYVTVAWSATMGAVKLALATKLGKQEILNNGRIVKLESGHFTSYKDAEPLGKRRRLLFLGADLVPRLGPSGQPLPLLSVDQGKALQDELLEGFGAEEFQSRLKELESNNQMSALEFGKARRDLLFEVQSKVLPKYGFPASYEGVFDMQEAFFDILNNEEIQRKADELEQLLRLAQQPPASATRSGQPSPALAVTGTAPAQEAAKIESQEVTVVIKHALDLNEVELTVKTRSTMWEIREALAANLSRPDVAQKARFVRALEDGVGFSSLKDSDRLGSRRKLLLLGVDLPKKEVDEGEGDADSDADEEAEVRRKGSKRRAPKLTLEQALALQDELLQGFQDEDFQAEFTAMRQNSLSQAAFMRDRQNMLLVVQSKILPKYGFSADGRGVLDMVNAMIFDDPEFSRKGEAIDRLLGLNGQESPTTAAPASEKAADKTVEVRVRHAIDNDEVFVVVPKSAKMSEVVEAVAKEINNSGVLQGRIVQKQGSTGTFAAYPSSEALGKRRRLLFLGAELKAEDGWVRRRKSLLKEAAVALQRDLIAGFRTEIFQAKLEELAARHRLGSPIFITERVNTALEVQKVILPKHGFAGSIEGVSDMMWSFRDFDNDLEVQYLGGIINSMLWPGLASLDGDWLSGDQVVTIKGDKVHISTDEAYDFEETEDLKCVIKMAGAEFEGQLEPDRCKFVWSNGEVWTREFPPVEPAPEPPGPASVPVARARLLLRSIKEALQTPQAQRIVKQDSSNSEGKRNTGLLFTEVCGPVIKEFGFERSRAGFDRMFGAIFERREDAKVIAEAQAAEELLGVQPGSWFGIVSSDAAGTAEVKKDEATKPQLTLGRAQELLTKFQSLFKEPLIAQQLTSARQGDESQRQLALGTIFANTCRPVVIEFGFSSNKEGFEQMFDALFEHKQDPTLVSLALDIEKSLGVPRSSWFGFNLESASQAITKATDALPDLPLAAPVPAEPQEPSEPSTPRELMEVRVKHATSLNEIFVLVNVGSNFKQLRQALADKVNDPEILKAGRLVKKKGAFFKSYKDDEMLGKRRRLLYLGTELPHDPRRAMPDDDEEAADDMLSPSGTATGNGGYNMFFAKPKDEATRLREALEGDDLDDIFGDTLAPQPEPKAVEEEVDHDLLASLGLGNDEEIPAEADHDLLASLGLGEAEPASEKVGAAEQSSEADRELLASLGLGGAEPDAEKAPAAADRELLASLGLDNTEPAAEKEPPDADRELLASLGLGGAEPVAEEKPTEDAKVTSAEAPAEKVDDEDLKLLASLGLSPEEVDDELAAQEGIDRQSSGGTYESAVSEVPGQPEEAELVCFPTAPPKSDAKTSEDSGPTGNLAEWGLKRKESPQQLLPTAASESVISEPSSPSGARFLSPTASPTKRSEAAASDSVISVPSTPSSPAAAPPPKPVPSPAASGLPPDKLAALQVLGLSVDQAVAMGILSAADVAASSAAAPAADPEPSSTASAGLQGTWNAEDFTIVIGENSATFSTGEVLELELSSTSCCLRLEGEEHHGHLQPDGKTLVWDDGDTWVRQ